MVGKAAQLSGGTQAAPLWLPWGLMFMVVLFTSLIPVGIAVGGGLENPFLFNAVMRLGLAAGLGSFMAAWRPAWFFSWLFWRGAARLLWTWTFLGLLLGTLEFSFFALAASLVGTPLAALLLELWPIGMALLLGRFLFVASASPSGGSGPAPAAVPWRGFRAALPGLLLGFLGVVVVAVGSAPGGVLAFFQSGSLFLVGLAPALLSPVAGSLGSLSMVWGMRAARSVPSVSGDGLRGWEAPFFASSLAFGLGGLGGAVLNGAIGFAAGESFNTSLVLVALLVGATTRTWASTSMRLAVFLSRNPGVSAVGYAVPVFSLIWLSLLGFAGGLPWVWLLVGAAAVALGNYLVSRPAPYGRWLRSVRLLAWRRAW